MTKSAKFRAAMSDEDGNATDSWFSGIKSSCKQFIKNLKRLVDKTPAGGQKTLLEGELVRLRATVTMLEHREEAFVAENSSQAMRPPSDEDIKETKLLATRMADAIAKEKKAEAIAELINELGGLASRVSTLTDRS